MRIIGVIVVVGCVGLRLVLAQNPTPPDVLTHRYDNERSGLNLHERQLNTSNVNNNMFGKLAFRTVDGNMYAQPLIVSKARIVNRASPVDVVIVATEHNSVYAFDAGDTSEEKPGDQKALWYRGPANGTDGSFGLGHSIETNDLYQRIGFRPARISPQKSASPARRRSA